MTDLFRQMKNDLKAFFVLYLLKAKVHVLNFGFLKICFQPD